MTPAMSGSVAAGIFAATELIKLGVQLSEQLAGNPSMTAEEVAQKVRETRAKALMTVDGWRAARRESDGPPSV